MLHDLYSFEKLIYKIIQKLQNKLLTATQEKNGDMSSYVEGWHSQHNLLIDKCRRQSFFCRFTSARLPSKTSVTAAASCKETPGAEGCWPPAFWEVQHNMDSGLTKKNEKRACNGISSAYHRTEKQGMTYDICKNTTYVGSVPSCSESSLASREHLIQQL